MASNWTTSSLRTAAASYNDDGELERSISWRRLCLFILFLMGSFLLGSFPWAVHAEDLLQKIQHKGQIVIGVKTDYPPWGMLDQQQQYAGFEPDLARSVAKAMGVQVSFKTVTSANRFQKLNDQEVDLLIATVSDTQERRQHVHMVVPHYFRSGVNILTHQHKGIHQWADLIGQPVCLTAGAYFNKTLVESYRIVPVILMSNRDAKLALMTNKCQAWAYDSVILFHLSQTPQWQDYSLPLETILPTHWSFVTRQDGNSQSLSQWLSSFLMQHIRSGQLKREAAKWELPEIDYLTKQHELWTRVDAQGQPICGVSIPNSPDEQLCIEAPLRLGETKQSSLWPFDHFDTQRLIESLLHTTFYTLIALVVTLGWAFCFSYLTLYTPKWLGKSIAFLTHIQSTIPPILMLYLIYFGALSYWAKFGQHWLLAGVAVSLMILSLYTAAGINNLIIADPNASGSLLHRYLQNSTGVKANLVNLAKAAGMASVIASPNAVLIMNSLVASSGHPFFLMSLLATFYYVEVMLFAGLIQYVLSRWSHQALIKTPSGESS